MSIRRISFFLLVAVAFLIATGIPTKSQFSTQNNEEGLVAGRNVNMTSSKEWPDPEGDLYLQRQNEPSLAVSTLNPLHLLAGANDYRSVDTWESQGQLPGIPEEATAGDAWLGVFTSYDGGQSWKSKLLPGYLPGSGEVGDSLRGFDAASDPTVRAGIDGFFYYSGIAFDRKRKGSSVIFVARFRDYNDTESGDSIRYVDTKIIDEGTSGQFADKPWMAVDIPRLGYSNGFIYMVYSIFLGDITKTVHNKIMFTRSTDGGNTWELPIKLSESHQTNQGTTVAIDPLTGYVYVAWRQFAKSNKPDAILVARSTNCGLTFTKATEVAIIDYPFDQRTFDSESGTIQFRTNAFPTITADNSNRIYIAWTQRESEDGPARIVVKSSSGGLDWSSPPITVEDNVDLEGHQFMPSMTFAAGKLMIAWYDSRESVRLEKGGNTEKWITDYYLGEGECPDPPEEHHPCYWRETIDVRIAQANPGALSFEPSTQVSRYIWFFEVDRDGNPVKDQDDNLIPIQVQFNAPNYPLFQGGTVPFIGDYIDLVPAPMFINDGGNWRFNTGHSDPDLPPDPFVFYVSWTDNRDVRPPDPNLIPPGNPDPNPWSWYGPPDHNNCWSGFNAGMRNQNIYVSRITNGISVGCPGNYKPSGGPEPKAFVVNVENMTSSPKSFDMNILNPPPDGTASFSPSKDLRTLKIDVDEYSSISRHVFVQSDDPHTTIVQVTEVPDPVFGGDFIGYVNLYLVAEGGSEDESITLDIIDGGIVNWSDPLMPNADIFNATMFNATMFNATMFNATMFNATMFNATMFNATMFNGNIANPFMSNSSFESSIDGAEIVEHFWQVTNTGETASSYTLKTIAGDGLPPDYYSQLLVYKVLRAPATGAPATEGECTLLFDDSHELLLNIDNPNVTPDIDTYAKIVDPELANVGFTNATFSLSPGEYAIVILRVIDTSNPPGSSANGAVRTLNSNQTSDAEEYAGNVGAVVISHSSTEGDITAITLMVLPDSLPSGQAGVPYEGATIRAIGGKLEGENEHYSWHVDGLPSGLKYDSVYDPDFDHKIEISGDPYPRQAGNFLITVEVTDHSSPPQTDTQTFELYIEEAPLFTLEVDQNLPLVADMNTPYSLKFKASGGVPWHAQSTRYGWDASASTVPNGLDGKDINTETNHETLELYGTPTEAGDFAIVVTVRDYSDPEVTLTKNINLCVRPPEPLDIVPVETRDENPCPGNPSDACILPDGEIGSDYSIILNASNSVGSLLWEIDSNDKLPPGLQLSSPSGWSIEIRGTPEYNVNITYPKTYTFDVQLTDLHISSCTPVARTISRKFTITLNPKQPAWFAEGTQNGEATAVAADLDGNVYVTGYTFSEGTGKDYYTARYTYNAETSMAEEIWKKTYNGPGKGDDIPSAIAVDSSGIYVTGTSKGRRSGPDFYTIKYDAKNGNVLWEDRYDGPSHLGDFANALTLDDEGNVYVAGYVHRGKQKKHADYCIIKYSSLGEMIWDERYDSTRNGSDFATAIAVDSAGNVYLTGKSQESLKKVATTYDYLTLKYNSRGRLQWLARDDGPDLGDDEPTDIALYKDSSGNVYVYVTGYTSGGMSGKDYYTVKYDAEGNGTPDPAWGILYNGTENGDDILSTSIAVDELSGDVYVTGKSLGTNGYDFATIKYGSDGTPLWNTDENPDDAIRHDGGSGDDEAVAVAVDGTGIYVAGFSTKEEGGIEADKDFFVIKYDTSGDIIWIASYDGSSGKDDVARDMAVNSTGIFVVGYSEKVSIGTVFAVVKYDK